ncbi:2-dehydro-3-deoxyglucarate aldolase [Massilia sp. Root418]|jgi:4-hydroxy-2-oxoheptanedioate aldolase|uniref:aldolase/citrate lyase family protein n=1 Tax=Massilia sp. Root418 TaxID=1736532 RepID=UPI0006F3D84F|nr:aldolase/citrate lyase family protein [Massilia sp. Root418]KQW87176.1 2-dehydro-3-deoxyglucarate aldolase [Massilia sp. Root418]
MSKRINHFKRTLKGGTLQIGLWSGLSSNVTVEVLANAGFDWLLLDMEHSPNELPMVHSQLQAIAQGTAQPIVRPPWNDTVVIKRLLDVGAQTLLIPFVQNAEEARQAVAATRYPPHGVRGFSTAARASDYGRVADYWATSSDDICVLLQVETPEAIANIEEIAAVEGVDGIFIGPGDLAASMGHLANLKHPDVVAAIEGAVRRIVATGKAAGVLMGDEALARRYIAAGCTYTAVGSDIGLLARGAEALAGKFKNAA